MTAPSILTAAQWGRTLRPGTQLQPMPRPATYWIVHHTAGSTRRTLVDELRMVNADALDEGKTCIDYSFAVTLAGEIGEGRGWGIIGAHTGTDVKPGLPRAGESYNACGHAIVFVGDYHNPGGPTPTKAQLAAAAWLIAEGVRLGHVEPEFRTIGHRTAGHANGATACPGDRLFPLIPALEAQARALLNPEDDMPTADEIRQIVRDEIEAARKAERKELAKATQQNGWLEALIEIARRGAARAK